MAAAALSAVAMLISPQWDCMCPCTRDCVCPEESREGRACRACRPGSAWGVVPPRGSQPPGSLHASPSLALCVRRPTLAPALPLDDCRIEPVHFHGVLASVLAPQPSVSSAWRRAGPASGSPAPSLACKASLAAAFPWLSLSPPHHLTAPGVRPELPLAPWLTSHLPPKTATLKTATLSAGISRSSLGQHPHLRSVLAQMLQNGQLPKKALVPFVRHQNLGSGLHGSPAPSAQVEGSSEHSASLPSTGSLGPPQIHVAGNWLRTSVEAAVGDFIFT